MEEAGLASDQEEGEEPTPGGGGGRLKRARASEQQQERGDGLDDGLEDEDDGAQVRLCLFFMCSHVMGKGSHSLDQWRLCRFAFKPLAGLNAWLTV